jgi:hypothetical protein
MTFPQIIALILAGPIALFLATKLLLLLFHGKGDFHILESVSLLICVTFILMAFFGVH